MDLEIEFFTEWHDISKRFEPRAIWVKHTNEKGLHDLW